MEHRYFLASLTRITPLAQQDFEVRQIPRAQWKTGDYIACCVEKTGGARSLEMCNGRMIEIMNGDSFVGALGKRYATLEVTGDWEKIQEGENIEILTGAGLLGRVTSSSTYIPSLTSCSYSGHVHLNGKPVAMRDFVKVPRPLHPFNIPSIVIVGSSMSAGKTTAARIIIRQLKKLGLKVVAAKLAGAGRYRDVLTMGDAGADNIFDFADVGMPSTVVSKEEYSEYLPELLSMMAQTQADIAVIEIGASPLEPYNGEIAVKMLQDQIKFRVLCASDPYAVYGIMRAFDFEPDLISGIATNTFAGVELINKICGNTGCAINILDAATSPMWTEKLKKAFQV